METTKLDNIFLKVINDPELKIHCDIATEEYQSLNDGLLSEDPYVKVLAKMLKEIDVKLNEIQTSNTVYSSNNTIELSDSQKKTLYSKLMSELTE